MHPAGMDASPLRMPGNKNLSHVHSHGTWGAMPRAACSSGTDEAVAGVVDAPDSTEERGSLPAGHSLEGTAELVGDLDGGRIPDKPAEIRCHEIQALCIELMLSLALVAERAYSFCTKAAASATAGERETSGRGGKSGDMDAIADSDRNAGHGDFKGAAA